MLVGLMIGFVLGLLVSPVIRSWLAWREFVDASREARLTEDVLRHMAESLDDDVLDEDPSLPRTG